VLARQALDTIFGKDEAVKLIQSGSTSIHACYWCGFDMEHVVARTHERRCKKIGQSESFSISVYNKSYRRCGKSFAAEELLRTHRESVH